MSDRVILNVGGIRHEVAWSTLGRLPRTRLGRLHDCQTEEARVQFCDEYSRENNEYYFDRHPKTFSSIIHFYRTGKLHFMEEMCVIAFSEELEYWGVSELYLEPCCQCKYFEHKDLVFEAIQIESEGLKDIKEDFGSGKCAQRRKKIWNMFEKPNLSCAGKVLVGISTMFIVLSTTGLIIGTLPDMQQKDENGEPVENPHLYHIEAVCIAWFTFEYVVRFFAAPDKWSFVKAPLNIIDLVSIVPYYVTLLLIETTNATSHSKLFSQVLQMFRVLRMLRILKLARHSVPLQSLGFTLRNSFMNLMMLLMFLGMGVLLFSSLEYFAERNVPETKFTSILETFWWAGITMTTVGYGDMCPSTPLGKMISAVTCICGVLVIALPIPIIAENFSKFHLQRDRRAKAKARQQELLQSLSAGSMTLDLRHELNKQAQV